MNAHLELHPVVQTALDAFHAGDKTAWLELFAPGAQLFDDGSPRDIGAFTEEALGHERFTNIQRVANEGMDVFGEFHSDEWGDFPAYFKFHLDESRKINRLDIGQA